MTEYTQVTEYKLYNTKNILLYENDTKKKKKRNETERNQSPDTLNTKIKLENNHLFKTIWSFC